MPVLHSRLGRGRVAQVVEARDGADEEPVVAFYEQERVSEVTRRVGHASPVISLDAVDRDRVLECRVGHVCVLRLLQPLLRAIAAGERHHDLHHHPARRLLDPRPSEAGDEAILREGIDSALHVDAADGGICARVKRALEDAGRVGGELHVAGGRRLGEHLAEVGFRIGRSHGGGRRKHRDGRDRRQGQARGQTQHGSS